MSQGPTASIQELLVAAQRLKTEGRKSEAADLLIQAIEQNKSHRAALPRGVHGELCILLYELGRYEDALHWSAEGLARLKKDFTLTNLRGILFRRLSRYEEALACFREAGKLDSKSIMPIANAGNVYLDLHDGPRAIEAFSRIVRQMPRSSDYQRLLGMGHFYAGDLERARRLFELARQLAPNDPMPWISLANVLEETNQFETALATLDQAIARIGLTEQLMTSRLAALRRNGRFEEVVAWLQKLIVATPDDAVLHYQLGRTLTRFDRDKANECFARALALAPDDEDIIAEYAESLDRTRGPEEPKNIAQAYELAHRRKALGGNLLPDARILRNIMIRSADYAGAERLGSFEELGAYWARTNQETALHHLMGQIQTPEQRRHLVSWHRIWGQSSEKRAAQTPLRTAPAITGRAKIRVGFMSSDLRHHPVAYFAAPLIVGYDRSRFEFYCYSWNTKPEDGVQQRLSELADVFRLHPTISDRDAAQLIADDQLDVLFELGGSTDMNKIRTMAWRPAPRQASWLGYPHSAGIGTIDKILTDPFITPPDPALLIEKPLELAHSWVAFEQPGFGPLPGIEPTTPEEREGRVTFGTMNNPYKYNPTCIETWAAILRAVPGSRFLFVRPEGAVPSFRANIERLFAEHGIEADRVSYMPVRGTHLPHYNAIDVALDTFPQTGGTTTCETLWMGVPVVSLLGEAFFERLSHSNLNNAGLGDLCVTSREAYIAKAVEIAKDTAWRTELRRTMRERLRSHPLGRPDLFVHDFQEAVVRWMEEPRP
ncbi:O-linked N-acetylglucosamine transferase, SPINDLY family protein [Microvirga alba]|uniref:protein O-GlcNAc transferase n=1 Tax=Microvirga alba TaxID=2791025 RepID=A0A931BQU7_9HYPH|nr:tetratricopeptide repeat protein [Microvirga alba]MBF9232923.1 tetratricopeptide repeat protein [Microvirga alba]